MVSIPPPKLVNKISFPGQEVNALAFSPNSEYFASASDDKFILSALKYPADDILFEGHEDDITSLCLADDFIVSSSNDLTARLWRLEATANGNPRRRETLLYSNHNDIVNTVDISLDEKQICTASNDKTIRIWSTTHSKKMNKLINEKKVHCAKFSKYDHDMLASCGGDRSIRIWDLRTGQVANFFFSDDRRGVHSLAWSPQNSYILASGDDNSCVRIWDVRKCESFQTYRMKGKKITSIDFHESGVYLAASQYNGVWRIIDISHPKFMFEDAILPDTNNVTAIKFSPDGQRLVTAGEVLVFYESNLPTTMGSETQIDREFEECELEENSGAPSNHSSQQESQISERASMTSDRSDDKYGYKAMLNEVCSRIAQIVDSISKLEARVDRLEKIIGV